MGKWWHRLIPTYGNWGGPGWSGGQRGEPDFSVNAVDSLDRCFYNHDWEYHVSKFEDEYRNADARLIQALWKLDPDPREWSQRPQYRFEAKVYRQLAVAVFSAGNWVKDWF